MIESDAAIERPLAPAIRRLVIEHAYRAGVGHVGSALSIAEIVGALYSGVVQGAPDDPARDRVVLSKGHAALALFAALALTGRLPVSQLDTYCREGTRLGVHPEPGAPGIDVGTGSLGTGLSFALGLVLAARLRQRASRSFVVMSDAELNEGSVWEAAQLAGHHRLGSLVAVVDCNGQQAFGRTAEVIDLRDPGGAFAAFGWDVVHVNGHDEAELAAALDVRRLDGPPRVVLAATVFGRGVSFMEHQIPWHYLPLDDEQHRRALEELAQS